MTRIEIRRPHALPTEEAKKRAERLTVWMRQMFAIECQWFGDRLVFHVPQGLASGTGGYVDVASTYVHVLVDVPFLYSMFKGEIESKIIENMERMLAA